MNDNELPPLELHPDFGELESMMNLRDWFEALLEKNGAEITDAGMGMGAVDLGFRLEGYPFSMRIKARTPNQ